MPTAIIAREAAPLAIAVIPTLVVSVRYFEVRGIQA
jgi:hypothetical protein